MSTRQENQKILMATHLPTFKRLKIIDPYFIAKSAWAPPGEPLKMQFFPNELKQGRQMVIGTPGRVFDMLQRNAINPDFIKILVIRKNLVLN